jgi:hypothetical protein
MNNLTKLPLLISAAALLAFSQQTRQEITRPANPAEDGRPNSDNVPDAYAITSQFKRVVILRFKYDIDLLAGLQRMVREQKIKNGVILAGIGSVRRLPSSRGK